MQNTKRVHRKIESKEMLMAKRFVKRMIKYMPFDENMEKANWKRNRRKSNFFYSIMHIAKGVKVKKLSIGRLGALKISPLSVDESQVIVYFHGGGFVTGSAYSQKSYPSMIAAYSGYTVYSVEYSLAPEHKYPIGFEDCCIAFEEIVKRHPQARIIVTGESAGGNLSLAIALKYKETGRITKVIVHSPTLDFSGKLERNINENKDFIVRTGCAKPLYRMYVGENDSTDPFVSPYYGNYEGFPPTFITCDVNETLYADALALYEKCIASHVEAAMIEVEGGFHAFATTGDFAPETAVLLKETIDFIKK